ncbi:hypothetical protein CLV92_101454 [Kineococcus xinjiangensis]|uniref:Uncharacterized protein n=1 Tax=Kineococcus xinjiangensis TaxID=512762 RepID=A0A2S6IWP6_9ACTN|nr:hypothetical protein [Kineococcus xinjiangensis]PPK98753.1 hypothetical protein CLV92_101454 [Kineococcus xinjiangensis]
MDIMTMLGGTSFDACCPSYARVRIPATTSTRSWGEVRPVSADMRAAATTSALTGGEVRLQFDVVGTRHVAYLPKPVSGTRRFRSTTV